MSEVADLEYHRDGLKKQMRLRDLAMKLSKNRDFRELILEEFMTVECARYVQLSADPSLDAVGRADALAIAQSAGHLKRYLSVVTRMGNQAEHDLIGTEEAIEFARQAPEVEAQEDDDQEQLPLHGAD